MRHLCLMIITCWEWGAACGVVGLGLLLCGVELGKVLLAVACGFAAFAAVFVGLLGLVEAAGAWRRRRRVS